MRHLKWHEVASSGMRMVGHAEVGKPILLPHVTSLLLKWHEVA